jgi:tape measure domain-containing protein
MATTTLDLKVTADAKAAVQGLKPLSTALSDVTETADKTETALKDLDKKHTINLNDQAIENARKEISRLRQQMRQDLSLDVNANTKAAQRRIRELQSTVRTLDAERIEIEADVVVDATTTGGLSRLRDALAGADDATDGLVPGLGMLGKVAGRAGGPLVVVGAAVSGWKLGQAAADVETMVVQLDALTDGHGAQTMKDIQKWAALTPFAIEDAATATKKLVAAGVDLQNIPDYLNDIGNIAAATGVPIDQLGTVFAQMESKGKATYEELQQIAEAGVPVWATLAEQLGLTTAEVQKLATEGKLGADAIDLARESLAGLYPSAMADQAETFNGQMSTLQDNLSQIGSTLGTTVLPYMSQLVGDFNDLAGGALDLAGNIADLSGNLQDMRQDLHQASQDGKTDLKDLMDIAQSPGILALGTSWEKIQELFGKDQPKQGIEETGDAAKDLAGKIKDGFDEEPVITLEDALKDANAELDKTLQAFTGLGGGIRSKVDFLISRDDIRDQLADAVKDGVKLPRNLTLPQVEFLPNAQQDMIQNLQSFVETGLEEGARRAKLDPTFDSAGWLAKLRTATKDQLVKVGIDPGNAEKVLSDVFGLPRTAKVAADVSAAQAALDGLTAPTITPIFTPLVPTSVMLPAAAQSPVITPTVNPAPANAVMAGVVAPRVAVVAPKLEGIPAAKSTLDNISAPRQAKIVAVLDSGGVSQALAALTGDRYVTVHVTARQANPSGADNNPSTPFPTSIVPQLFGADTRTVAGLRAASLAAPQMVATHGTTAAAPAAASTPSTRTVLAPKQVPVKVYLDGAEIADHLTIKASRVASASTVRRRA